MKLNLQDVMRRATELTRAGQLNEATAAIQRALGGTLPDGPAPRSSRDDVVDVVDVVDVAAVERPWPAIEQGDGTRLAPVEAPAAVGESVPEPASEFRPGPAPLPELRRPTHLKTGVEAGFVAGSHTHASLTRSYKLFIPPAAIDRSLPLVVMLHGCKQDPDDFAAGTQMNRLAVEFDVCILYPAQAHQANPSKCWNWFKHNHQGRDRGEPALIASMTRQVINSYGIDPDRVYIAGLSAGGAMAAIVGAAYPDLFAAVGVHSGLAPGAARTLPEALMAMKGNAISVPAQMASLPGNAMNGGGSPLPLPLPVIVFHGDEDRIVHPGNADQVIAAALRAADARHASTPLASRSNVEHGASDFGRRYTRHVHDAGPGQPIAEHWVLHGAGHAWSGGNKAGSFTDPAGPNASREMLRFFLENPRRSFHRT